MVLRSFRLSFDIADNVRRHGFKRLLLAVSGGLDSICLAHYFIENREALGIEWLGIAHVHHGLREGTADRDAESVEAFAKAHNVPFFLKKLDGEALKSAEGSLEENAREARYTALFDVIGKEIPGQAGDDISRTEDDICENGDDSRLVIVTAHHAGDQAETMYMRLRRGTTLAGLRGIQELRVLSNELSAVSQGVAGLASEAPLEGVADAAHGRSEGETSPLPTAYCLLPTISLYRPLLSVTRAELLAYAREHNLTWCEDESNTDVKFARNKIRHEFLPHLEDSSPGATKQLCRIAELADKAYGKVMSTCKALFNSVLQRQEEMPGQAGHDKKDAGMTNNEKNNNGLLLPRGDNSTKATSCQVSFSFARNDVQLNKKALRKILLAHTDADLSEMFRLWLSELGFRFPIGFFYDQNEPAHVKIPVRAAYRKRSILKMGSTIRICEFESVEDALKFVSCK